MTDKRIEYIDYICREIQNILITTTYSEITHIHISLDWDKGEEPYLFWEYHGKNETEITIAESEV